MRRPDARQTRRLIRDVAAGRGNLTVTNPDVAGIDVGSETHVVAISPDLAEEPIRSFGCTTPELREMAGWLQGHGVTSVALEATGVYWVPIHAVLEDAGLSVTVFDPRQAKRRKKTDVADAEWIRTLHSYGLLHPCYVPDHDMSALRTYARQRDTIVNRAADEIRRMQKALEQMNIQLAKVVSDISGVTGMSIIRAIVAGERDPYALADLRDRGCKASRDRIADSLTGNYRTEHVFALTQALATYDHYQRQLMECDRAIEELCRSISRDGDQPPSSPFVSSFVRRYRRKSQPHFNMRAELKRLVGVDLTRIEGIDALTAFKVISECGTDFAAFPTRAQFCSWLGLCPNNRISGGKVHRRRTNPSANRAATALRIAAQSLHRSDSAIGAFLRRMRGKLGPPKAITATAHKLARLIYDLVTKGEEYVMQSQELYERQQADRERQALARRAAKHNLVLLDPATGVVLS